MPEQSLEARVAVLDSQIQTIMRDFNGLSKLFPSIRDTADIEQKVAILEAEVVQIKSKLDKKIEKNEFWPVRAIAYGLAGVILLTVLGALLKGVVPVTGISN